MNENVLTVRVALQLDEKWAGNFSKEELQEILKARLDYSLGFRGEVKKLKIVSR